MSSHALQGKMVYRDGYYWFAHTSPMFDRPEVVTSLWKCWPAVIGDSSYDGSDAWMYSNDFGVSVSWKMGENAGWTREQYVGTSRRADIAEVVPLPCPKVRKGTETRYRNGQWQKYTVKGFVTA